MEATVVSAASWRVSVTDLTPFGGPKRTSGASIRRINK